MAEGARREMCMLMETLGRYFRHQTYRRVGRARFVEFRPPTHQRSTSYNFARTIEYPGAEIFTKSRHLYWILFPFKFTRGDLIFQKSSITSNISFATLIIPTPWNHKEKGVSDMAFDKEKKRFVYIFLFVLCVKKSSQKTIFSSWKIKAVVNGSQSVASWFSRGEKSTISKLHSK